VAIKNQEMSASAFLQAWVGNQLTASFREAIGIAIVAIKKQEMSASASLAHLQTHLQTHLQIHLQTQLQLHQQQRIQTPQRLYALKMVHVMGTLVQ
jgi:hypothetical protein